MADLPQTYSDLVDTLKQNKDNPESIKTLVNNLLAKFNDENYDLSESIGHIAATNEESYRLLMGHTPVKNAMCGTEVQVLANAFNDAGYESRLTLGTMLEGNNGGGGHYGFIYSLKKGQYVFNSWEDAIEFKANDMLDAVKKAKSLSPAFSDGGFDIIMSKDGNHMTYQELSVGDLLPENIDKNSPATLKKSFDAINPESTGEKVKITPYFAQKNGVDKYHGDYSSTALGLKPEVNFKVGDFKIKTNGNFNYDSVVTANNPPGTFDKKNKYDIYHLETSAMTTTPELKLSKEFSGELFARTNIEFTEVYSKTTEIDTKKNTLSGPNSQSDFASSQTFGAELTSKNIQAAAFGGVRVIQDKSIYKPSDFFGIRPEDIFGGKIQASKKINLGDKYNLTLKGEVSDVYIIAPDYTTNSLSSEGRAELSKGRSTGTIYGGYDRQTINFDGLTGTNVKSIPYAGAGYEVKANSKLSLGVDCKTTGKNFSCIASPVIHW